MTKSLLLRRGTSIEHALFTGLKGELTFDTEKNTAVAHDGKIMGGFPLAREDLSNVSDERLSERGISKNDLSNVSLQAIDERGIARKDFANITDELLTNRGIAKTDLSNIGETGYAEVGKRGIIDIADSNDLLLATDNTKAITPYGLGMYMQLNGGGTGGSPMGYLYGFTINKTSDKTIIVGMGQTKSTDNSMDIVLRSAMEKNLNAEWSEGNGGGTGVSTELLPNTMYNIFVIVNANGYADIGIDTNRNAENLMQKLSVFEYTKYRRIAAFWTDTNANISDGSIAYNGTFKSDWFSSIPNAYTKFSHNLNVPETDQRARLFVQMQKDKYGWTAGDIVELCYVNHSENVRTNQGFGAVFCLKRNEIMFGLGNDGILFFHSGDGSLTNLNIKKSVEDVKYMVAIDYPTKYDL
ncbi:MAG: hypothetical protein LBU68_01245 [Rickettsiales bacterium]|nr:hypothetical protein [Rickettsiales bacterium]